VAPSGLKSLYPDRKGGDIWSIGGGEMWPILKEEKCRFEWDRLTFINSINEHFVWNYETSGRIMMKDFSKCGVPSSDMRNDGAPS
jgi:hypothetical protein